MQAIILAAGKGSRISDSIAGVPKSTLKINNHSIIYLTVNMLLRHNISVNVCTGYKEELIRAELEGLPVRYIHNPFYNEMNNMGTLWFAKDIIHSEDILIMSADVLFEECILEKIIESSNGFTMVVDKSRIKEGDYFFQLDSGDCIIDYGSELSLEKRDCEYVGISKIGAVNAEKFKERLQMLVEQGKYREYLETIFFSFLPQKINTVDISGMQWREIDHYEDYLKAIQQFEK